MKLKFIYLQAEPCSFSTLFYLTDDEFIAHGRKLTKTSGNHKVRGPICTLGIVIMLNRSRKRENIWRLCMPLSIIQEHQLLLIKCRAKTAAKKNIFIIYNEAISFSNLSSNAVPYVWRRFVNINSESVVRQAQSTVFFNPVSQFTSYLIKYHTNEFCLSKYSPLIYEFQWVTETVSYLFWYSSVNPFM